MKKSLTTLSRSFMVWKHFYSLGEVMGALMEVGLQVSHFQEYDFSPYNCFPNLEEVAPKVFRNKDLGNKLPMVYSLTAVNKE